MRPRRSTEAESRRKGIYNAGVALAEFAFVAPLFLVLIFGIIEFSRVMLMYHHVGNAAREGSRYAIVHGSTFPASNANDTDVENYVKSISPLDPNNVIVQTVWENPADHAPKTWVKVQVSYDFKFILPILFGSAIPLTSTSQMVISY